METMIQIEASIKAPVSKVWKFWTEPEHIVKWNFAIPEWHCPTAAVDLKVGGLYKARMEARDGSFGFDFEAKYNEVIPEQKLIYTIADGRKVITRFAQKGESTFVVTEFAAENQNPVEMQKQGWQSILNNFKAYAEKV